MLSGFVGFIAGLGLFLLAMSRLERALHQLAGPSFASRLQQSTASAAGSVLSGTLCTAVLQSSSMVGLIVLALVGAGLLPLYNAIGMVIGANLGTTITGWLVTLLGFKLSLSAIAIPCMGIGGLLSLAQEKWPRWSRYGDLVFALGLLIFGIDTMKDSVEGLTHFFNPSAWAHWHSSLFLLMGVLFAAIIQSSSATILVTLNALSAGLIDLSAAGAVVIGADLGTVSTLLIGGLGGTADKRRVAMAHLLFNVSTAIFAYFVVLPIFVRLFTQFGLTDPLFSLVAFHSLFNLLGVLVMLPLLRPFASLLQAWFKQPAKPAYRFLTEQVPEPNRIAPVALFKETLRLWQLSMALNLRVLQRHRREHLTTDSYQHAYTELKQLMGAISEYALDARQQADAIHKSQFDGYLAALRKLNYSLKAVKDIRINLHDLSQLSNPWLQTQLSQQEQHDHQRLQQLEQLLTHSGDPKQEKEQAVKTLIEQLDIEHQAFVDALYQRIQSDQFDSHTLSSLINISKHRQESITASALACQMLLSLRGQLEMPLPRNDLLEEQAPKSAML